MENKYLMMHILDVHTAAPFKNLFMMRPDDLANITEDMKKNGYDTAHPIVVWGGHKGVVVDGHTRLQGAKDAGLLDVAVIMHGFADEDTALEYAIASQRNRRNITDGELLECIKALDNRKKIGRPAKTTSNEVISGRTSKETANLLGTSATKVEKLRAINEHATPEIRASLKKGDISINNAYNQTMNQRRMAAGKLPEYKPEDVKRERLKALEESICKIVAVRIERELNEYPEVRYSEDERQGLIDRCLPGVITALKNLPVDEKQNN